METMHHFQAVMVSPQLLQWALQIIYSVLSTTYWWYRPVVDLSSAYTGISLVLC